MQQNDFQQNATQLISGQTPSKTNHLIFAERGYEEFHGVDTVVEFDAATVSQMSICQMTIGQKTNSQTNKLQLSRLTIIFFWPNVISLIIIGSDISIKSLKRKT
jgi:hypothetical protein